MTKSPRAPVTVNSLCLSCTRICSWWARYLYVLFLFLSCRSPYISRTCPNESWTCWMLVHRWRVVASCSCRWELCWRTIFCAL